MVAKIGADAHGKGPTIEPEMARRLEEQEVEIDELKQRVSDVEHAARMTESDCKQLLAQHLRAHQTELARIEERHAAELQRLATRA